MAIQVMEFQVRGYKISKYEFYFLNFPKKTTKKFDKGPDHLAPGLGHPGIFLGSTF